MKNDKSDIDLWSQIKKGDAKAYQNLYDRYIDSLFTFGINYTDDETLVQDSIHDVFLELYRYRNTLAEQVTIKSYLFKSLHNDVLKKLKIQSKVIYLDTYQEDLSNVDSFEDEIILTETRLEKYEKLSLALSILTQKQRYALHLRFSEGLSYEEISSTLDITQESCRTLIYRSLKDVRSKL